MFNIYFQAGYLTLVQKSSEQNHKSIIEMLYVNSYNTLPIFLTVSMIMGEPLQVGEALTSVKPGFSLVFITLIVSGCVLTWAQFLCAAGIPFIFKLLNESQDSGIWRSNFYF